jgi:putative hemolysin
MTHKIGSVLEVNANKEAVKEFMLQELHSIYPVYNNNYDDIVGS